MLNRKVALQNIGLGPLTLSLSFEDMVKAMYLNVGDRVTDTEGTVFTVTGWQGAPEAFQDGRAVTLDGPAAGPVSSPFLADCLLSTPGQEDFTADMSVRGWLSSIELHSGPRYEYSAMAAWDAPAQAAMAVVGDHVLDSAGKEFYISHLSEDRFDAPIRLVEVQKDGEFPAEGEATMYKATGTAELYQGAFTSGWEQAAKQSIARIDKALSQSGGGGGSGYRGQFLTEAHLEVAIPVGKPGDYAVVEEPPTMAFWDAGAGVWRPAYEDPVIDGGTL
jgi:hypothetical protein